MKVSKNGQLRISSKNKCFEDDILIKNIDMQII